MGYSPRGHKELDLTEHTEELGVRETRFPRERPHLDNASFLSGLSSYLF